MSFRLGLLIIDFEIAACVADDENEALVVDCQAGQALRFDLVVKRHQSERFAVGLAVPFPEDEIRFLDVFRGARDDQEVLQTRVISDVSHAMAIE